MRGWDRAFHPNDGNCLEGIFAVGGKSPLRVCTAYRLGILWKPPKLARL